MSGPMDNIIYLAQQYKVATHGPSSEKALIALCNAVEKVVIEGIPRDQSVLENDCANFVHEMMQGNEKTAALWLKAAITGKQP